MKTYLWGAAVALAIGTAVPAHAFNVKNNTPWTICASSHTGDYREIVGPGQTSRGWSLNKQIHLNIVPYDTSVCDDDTGFCVMHCNDTVLSSVDVPAHAQLVVSNSVFEPGNVGENSPKGQWALFMLADAPAKFTLTNQ